MTRPLHVAVDARDLIRDARGIGTYARALLTQFAQCDDIRLTLLVRELLPSVRAEPLRAAIGARAASNVSVTNHVPGRADVVWHPWNGTFFSNRIRRVNPLRAAPVIPAVATIHDLVPFALPVADERRRTLQQTPFVRSARTARAIVCDSEFTAAQARHYLGIDSERLHVVPLGVDPVFAPGDLGALPAGLRDRPYILHVGAHDAHKNTETLVAAYRDAFPARDVALVFTRPYLGVSDALVYDNVDVATLVALYRGALVVAVPSIYEGFGLPVLEAMACGAPVLASRAASLPEVGGDAVAYVENPTDVEHWCAALRRLCRDAGERAELGRRGPLHAAGFRWERCARQTLDVLRGAAYAR